MRESQERVEKLILRVQPQSLCNTEEHKPSRILIVLGTSTAVLFLLTNMLFLLTSMLLYQVENIDRAPAEEMAVGHAERAQLREEIQGLQRAVGSLSLDETRAALKIEVGRLRETIDDLKATVKEAKQILGKQ